MKLAGSSWGANTNTLRQSDTMHLLHQRILVSAPVVSGLSFDWHNTSDEEKARGLVEVQQFITARSGKSVLVFTDGAVHNGAVGSGACAALLLPLSATYNKVSRSQAAGTKVDRTSCEMDGTALSLEQLLQYFTDDNNMFKSEKDAYILCDSSAAIDLVLCRNDNRKRTDLIKRIT